MPNYIYKDGPCRLKTTFLPTSFTCLNLFIATFGRKGRTKLSPELRVLKQFKPLEQNCKLAFGLNKQFMLSRFVKFLRDTHARMATRSVSTEYQKTDIRFESVKKIKLPKVLLRNFQMFDPPAGGEFLKIREITRFLAPRTAVGGLAQPLLSKVEDNLSILDLPFLQKVTNKLVGEVFM